MIDDFQIRLASYEDHPEINRIYSHARLFMSEHGNPRQWYQNGWPPADLLIEDISEKRLYVCVSANEIAAVLVYLFGQNPESCYEEIDGIWSKHESYGVVHRLASSFKFRGAGKYCILWALKQSGYLRIDTHPDNTIMQNLLSSLHFGYCGIIHVKEDSDPRYAYDYSEIKE